MLRSTVSLPVYLGFKPTSGAQDQFSITVSYGFVDVRRPLWREDGSVVYNCCWSSPPQSFSCTSPAGLMTTFYCLRFETPPTWKARSPCLYPSGTGWPNYTPRHWVSFSSRHGYVENIVSNITSIVARMHYYSSLYSPSTDGTQNVSSVTAYFLVTGDTCVQICYLATAVLLSLIYTAVTWHMSQYLRVGHDRSFLHTLRLIHDHPIIHQW
jgi:hypothetical protein